MNIWQRTAGLCVLLVSAAFAVAQTTKAAKPLSLEGTIAVLGFFDEKTVIDKIRRDGIDFAANEGNLQQLKKAGASDAVLAAVKQAAQESQAAKGSVGHRPLVEFKKLLETFRAGFSEAAIRANLEKSPARLVLDAGQVAQLKAAGASEAFIAWLKTRHAAPLLLVDVTHLAVILDCSGSMKENTKDGRPKMEVAKEVIAKLMKDYPNGLGLTFIIYGHDADLECRAVKIVHTTDAITSKEKMQLQSLIAKLQPAGHTPIALALKTAQQELADNKGRCGVVLISDGKETCHGDPIAAAASLADTINRRFGLRVVGFDVDADGQQQLQQVAAKCYGEFYAARDAAELKVTVPKVVEPVVKKNHGQSSPIIFKKSLLSAIVVKPLKLEGFPKFASISILPAGQSHPLYTVQSTKTPGKPMPVSPGKYDIWYQPTDGGKRTLLVAGLELPKNRTAVLDANRLVAAIVVRDPKLEGLELSSLMVLPTGSTHPLYSVQSAKQFGRPMTVTAERVYDVFLTPKGGQMAPIAKKVRPQPGKLTFVGEE